MGKAFEKGAVLVMSIWDDHEAHMLWLDSSYPTDKDPSTPGVGRGTCSTDSGKPDDVENQHPDAYVAFSNIKYGALYFSQMMKDGGMSEYDSNQVGAEFGTGYCDAQCPHDIKFIDGEGNSEGWEPSPDDKNAGSGKYGACCMEMDIWEANTVSTAFTAHPCSVEGHYRCSGEDCGDSSKDQRYNGVCDKDGCDLNTYRVGNHNFYGEGSNF